MESISRGMSGSAIAELHSRLLEHGVDVPASEVLKKRFGVGTLRAVKNWQQNHGLDPTGAIDLKTATSLGLEAPEKSRRTTRGTEKLEAAADHRLAGGRLASQEVVMHQTRGITVTAARATARTARPARSSCGGSGSRSASPRPMLRGRSRRTCRAPGATGR